MTRIYIIRHAEAEGNLYRRVHGWYDSLITDRGYRQIAALTGRFEHEKIDAVYSSDLFRTCTTAKAVYQPHELHLRTEPSLREISMGEWEDCTWAELGRREPERMRAFNACSPTWRAPGGESFAEVGGRMEAAIKQIALAHPEQTVAAFSHGTAIRMLQGFIQGLWPDRMSELGHSDNTAVTCVEVENGLARVVFADDNSHLPEEISTLASQRWWKCKKGGSADANLWFRCLDMQRESDFYYEARRDAWLDIHGSGIPFDGEGFLQQAMERWRVDHQAVTCVMLGEQPVGILELDLERHADEKVGYIPFVYLTPKYRRQGLGVQLLGEAVSVYRPRGRTRLRLRCAPDNHVAQRFYKRYGFQKIGAAPGARVSLDLLEKYIGY